MSNEQLQAFFLYCQAVETAYHEWKNYWVNFYLNNKQEDLYDPTSYIDTCLKYQKEIWHLPNQFTAHNISDPR